MSLMDQDEDEDGDAPEIVHWYPPGHRFGLPVPGSPQALTAVALAATAFGVVAVGALAICLLGAIPFVGGWVWLVACLLGAGALAVQGRQALAVAG